MTARAARPSRWLPLPLVLSHHAPLRSSHPQTQNSKTEEMQARGGGAGVEAQLRRQQAHEWSSPPPPLARQERRAAEWGGGNRCRHAKRGRRGRDAHVRRSRVFRDRRVVDAGQDTWGKDESAHSALQWKPQPTQLLAASSHTGIQQMSKAAGIGRWDAAGGGSNAANEDKSGTGRA